MRWLIVLVCFFLVPFASAITTTLLPSYQPLETIIIQIEGNILEPIYPSDVVFKRAHVAVAVNYDIKKLGGTYYLYATAPLHPNNYTLFIDNIATTVNGIVTEIDFNQSFTVAGNLTDYSISPGFALVTGTIATFTLQLNQDTPLTIASDFPSEQSITLQPGVNTLTFSTQGTSAGLHQATIGKYSVPIYLMQQSSGRQNMNTSLSVMPLAIVRTVLVNTPQTINITVSNNGSQPIRNLQLMGSELIMANPSIIPLLTVGENISVTLSFGALTAPLTQEIIIVDESAELGRLKLSINVTANENEVNASDTAAAHYYCLELQGKFCTSAEMCSVALTQALDGACCTGTCSVEEASGFGWVGYLALIAILAIILTIYLRYKKTSILPKPKPLMPTPTRV